MPTQLVGIQALCTGQLDGGFAPRDGRAWDLALTSLHAM